ncbi:MAG: sulfotransferase family 2 domain-containing protein [Sphingomonadaceae bacterium]|nr:sulfotransferase family 2 domain-containing protein [Sphingomonadaceae bacterium]
MATTLSGKHGYVFIHIPKTAGRSVFKALQKEADGQDFDSFLEARGIAAPNTDGQGYLKHHPARYVRKILGAALYDSLESVTVARNPYARIWSLYRYQRLRDWDAEGQPMPEIFEREFNTFVKELCEKRPRPMHEYVSSRSGERLVKSILKLESLSDDFAAWSSRIVGVPITLPEKGRTLGAVEDVPFSELSVETIQKTYALDFEMFDYDTAPPRSGAA